MEEFLFDLPKKYDSHSHIYYCGREKCAPNHAYGPTIRDHFLIHFVTSGKGTLMVNHQSFEITKNEGFIIFPNILSYYQADTLDPWHYYWIGFSGSRSYQYLKQMNLSVHNPIIRVKSSNCIIHYLEQMLKSSKEKRGTETRLLGYFYLFLSDLIEESEPSKHVSDKTDYIQAFIEFIEKNYSRAITIKEVTSYIGLNRNYFSNVFKGQIGTSPQNYLLHYRINKACELIEQNPNLQVKEIGMAVSYKDALAFSKAFKRIKGISPSRYKERMVNRKTFRL